ncbi:GPI transamidase component PIG-T, partial [Tetrabaena socialis]
DVFSEEALVSWLSPEHLLVHLRFDQATTASRIHTSFPGSIQHLAASLPLHSVELALTSGRWRYSEWGWPLVPAKPVLAAAFTGALDEAALAAHWSSLVHALSGLSCASLSLLQDPATVWGPPLRLQDLPRAGASTAAVNNSSSTAAAAGEAGKRLQALLPREALCTENLTPWLQLLPCRDQAGLASLLRHRPTVFGSEYVSLGLAVEQGVTRRGRPGVRLVQTATLVLRVPPSPDGSAAAGPGGVAGPALEQALHARVEHFCPAAIRSQVYVTAPGAPGAPPSAAAAPDVVPQGGGTCRTGSGDAADVAAGARAGGGEDCPLPGAAGAEARGDRAAGGEPGAPPGPLPHLLMYDTLEQLEADAGSAGPGLDIPLGRASPPGSTEPQPGGSRALQRRPPVWTERYLTGAGLLRGGMVLAVRRSGELLGALAAAQGGCEDAGGGGGGGGPGDGGGGGGGAVCLAAVVCVQQAFPWYVRPWVHTLEVLYDGKAVPLPSVMLAGNVRPALQRASPGVLDVCLHVPAHVAELRLLMGFSKGFLTAFEYPPDAHRGFDIPAALVSFAWPGPDPDRLATPALQWRRMHHSGDDAGGAGPSLEDAAASPLLAALRGGPVEQ